MQKEEEKADSFQSLRVIPLPLFPRPPPSSKVTARKGKRDRAGSDPDSNEFANNSYVMNCLKSWLLSHSFQMNN